jgi:hypothetical protein
MADKRLSGIAAEDIGKCAYGIFKKGPSMAGQTIAIAGEHITCADMAAAMSNAFGEEVRYHAVSPAVYRSFGFPGAEDLGNMFQFYQEFEQMFTEKRDIAKTKELNPELQSFGQWLAANAKRIPLN